MAGVAVAWGTGKRAAGCVVVVLLLPDDLSLLQIVPHSSTAVRAAAATDVAFLLLLPCGTCVWLCDTAAAPAVTTTRLDDDNPICAATWNISFRKKKSEMNKKIEREIQAHILHFEGRGKDCCVAEVCRYPVLAC